jgi:hypothetical protein
VVDPGKIHPIPPHWYMPADFNKDYKVSFADYLILEANFGESGMTNAQGDCAPVYWVDNYPYLVGDGKVSFADYLELEREFGGTWQPIPEPATIGLLALGGLAILRRR